MGASSHMAPHDHTTKSPCVVNPMAHTHNDGGLVVGGPSQMVIHDYATKPNGIQCAIDGPQHSHI